MDLIPKSCFILLEMIEQPFPFLFTFIITWALLLFAVECVNIDRQNQDQNLMQFCYQAQECNKILKGLNVEIRNMRDCELEQWNIIDWDSGSTVIKVQQKELYLAETGHKIIVRCHYSAAHWDGNCLASRQWINEHKPQCKKMCMPKLELCFIP